VVKQYVAGDGWIATDARHKSNMGNRAGSVEAGDGDGETADGGSDRRSGGVRSVAENSLLENDTFFERPVVPGER
jgi:hypothetical protein